MTNNNNNDDDEVWNLKKKHIEGGGENTGTAKVRWYLVHTGNSSPGTNSEDV